VETTEDFPTLYGENAGDVIEQQFEEDSGILQEFCSQFDNDIISYNAQITVKKNQIVTLSTEAINRNCWPGIAYSTITSSGTTRQTGVGISATENLGGNFSLRQDRDILKIFDNLAGPNADYTVDNPFDPDSQITLTTAYAGHGYQNVKDDNGGSVVGTAKTVSSTLADHSGPRNVAAFRAYAGVGVAPDASDTSLSGAAGQSRCVAIASSITAIEAEIVALRAERDTAISRTDLNTVKTNKTNKEIQDWGAKNIRQKVSDQKTKNASAIAAIKNLSP